jgi:hypothetical protein
MPRRWKCLACDQVAGSIGELNENECTRPFTGPAAFVLANLALTNLEEFADKLRQQREAIQRLSDEKRQGPQGDQ